MTKKAQASTEFLATYGWALLIMFLIVAALVGTGVFNPTRYANEECTFQPNLPCTQYYLLASSTQGGALTFNITNTMGFPIAIMGYAAQIENYLTDCFDEACSPAIYLKQGNSALITIDPLAIPNGFELTDVAKIKATLQFKNCQGKTQSDCISSTDSSYFTAGRINLFPREKLISGGTSAAPCSTGDKRCSYPGITGDIEVCTNGVWGASTSCNTGEICMQSANSVLCKVGSSPDTCVSGEWKCDGNIQVPCMEPIWGSPDINGQPCNDGSGGPICEDYMQGSLRKTQCIPQTIETCDPIPPLLAPASIGTQICDGNILNAYNECMSGGVWNSIACTTPGEVCSQVGPTTVDCVPNSLPLCTNPDGALGDQYCDPNLPGGYYDCTSNGWLGASCEPTKVCMANGNKIICQPPAVCIPGATRCNGDTVQVCQGGVFVDSQSCLNGCEMNGLTAQCAVCQIGSTQCVSDSYFKQNTCVDSGGIASWILEPCDPQYKCLNTECAPDPPPGAPDCIPSSLACGEYGGLNQNKVHQCIFDSQQNKWIYVFDGTFQFDCDAQLNICDRGACVPQPMLPECMPQDRSCGPMGEQFGLDVWECRGGVLTKTEYCEADTYCQNGQCVSR